MKKRKILLLLLLVSTIAFFLIKPSPCKGVDPGVKPQTAKSKNSPEKIVPSPKNIKESVGVYVFLGWTWLMIVVLVFILKQKIKEADRLYQMKFFPDKKE